MEKSINPNKCTGCGACAQACPAGCIKMVRDADGFLYPEIHAADCTGCGLCEKVCHYKKALPQMAAQKTYGASHKDEEIRLKSSSGGVFHALAAEILNRGGMVFGAALDDANGVMHMGVKAPEELPRLMGSKYVQSRIANTYKEAKTALEAGTPVLFTGTPCQIKGLRAFLGKDYEALFTMDFICHGVPSPLVWEKYLAEKEAAEKAKAERISFRAKTHGWKLFSMQIAFSNGTTYTAKVTEDKYLRCFLTNIALRKTCYACTAKGIERVSDITVADFWGVEKIRPEQNDNKGVSVMLLRSEKATRLLESIADKFDLFESDVETVQKSNPSLVKSVRYNPLRKRFLKDLKKRGFHKTFEKYCSTKLSAKLRRKIWRLLKLGRKDLE